MRVQLLKDSESKHGEIRAHVKVSKSDNQPDWIESHSFKYKVSSGNEGEILVYADAGDVDGTRYAFDLEKCRDKKCRDKKCCKRLCNKKCGNGNNGECPVLHGITNRLLVADVFHTKPSYNALQGFGTALFKALFSSHAGKLLGEIKPTHTNGRIFLQLNDHGDLDAIPWEYAMDGPTFLVHQRIFTRIHESPHDLLLERPLRIVIVAPDPLDLEEVGMADLHLGDQYQNFIDDYYKISSKVTLERVLPATVNRMNSLLKHDGMATVLHFMGHCAARDKKPRGLLFEKEETYKWEIANTRRIVSSPKDLRLAFLSACESHEVARELVQAGVRYTIGSYCSLPDDIARKFEAQFYTFLAKGKSINEAMWRTRMELGLAANDLRQQGYLAGTMILYSTTSQTDDSLFLCEQGEPRIISSTFLNNIDKIFTKKNIYGRKSELDELNCILRRMVTHASDSYDICTITGIGGQGKTTLAMKALERIKYIFPGGMFAWRFNDGMPISATKYLSDLVDTIFPDKANIIYPNDRPTELSHEGVISLGRNIFKQFHASALLILDHVDTLKRAEANGDKNAVALVALLKDVPVKILATSQEPLGWQKEKLISLTGLVNSDGYQLFIQSLSTEARERMKKEANKNAGQLLRDLVVRVDGHPSSLVLIGHAASQPQHSNKLLEDIMEHSYGTMLAEADLVEKSLKKHFGPMIDMLEIPQRLFLYMCSLVTSSITTEVLTFVSHFINYIGRPITAEARAFIGKFEGTIDARVESIVKNLEQSCLHGLLKKNTQQEYSIHVGFREGLRQHNIELGVRLQLPINGLFDDTFIAGVPSEQGISAILEWQLHNIKTNSGNRVDNRTFGIRYYDLLEKNTVPQQASFCGLVVFTCDVSKNLCDNVAKLCTKQIIPTTKEEKLPFILCLKLTDTIYAERNMVFLKEAMQTLQAGLDTTHLIVKIESIIGINQRRHEPSNSLQVSKIANKPVMTFKKEFGNMSPIKYFVGRQRKLEQLDELLNDEKIQYITIHGFGGLGKTALALRAIENFNSGRVLVLSLRGAPNSNSVISSIAEFLDITVSHLEHEKLWAKVNGKLRQKLDGEKTILIYLDNMEAIKHVADDDKSNPDTKKDANDMIRFFHNVPQNVKILATSRVELPWPNQEIIKLDELTSQEGMQVFRLWISGDRLNDVDDDNAMKISNRAGGHPLSIRLLGGAFNNSVEPINRFIDNFDNRLHKAKDNIDECYDSVNTCILYSYEYLDDSLRSLLDILRLFEVPFSATLVKKALCYNTKSSSVSTLSVATNLHKLRQHSWLNELVYDPTFGDWRPRFMEEDKKFYSLHSRLLDFLHNISKNVNTIPDNPEIQFYYTLCYGMGFGVVNNLEKQIYWCTKAATNGHLEAQLALAVCYEEGTGGVSKDLKRAFDWYLEAARAGDKGAQQKMEACFMKLSKLCEQAQVNGKKALEIKFDFFLPLLHRAVEYNRVILVRSLMMDQPLANVNAIDRHGRTPLYIAAEKGHIEMLNVLGIEFKANVIIKDNEGRSPLHRAAENKHFEVIQVLVAELGADINAVANDGQTPLHYLARDGHTEAVRLLTIELRANTKVKDKNGQTPLHRAAANGHVEVVRFLVAKLGADANFKDSDGLTPLHLAADNRHIEVVRLLVADPGTDDGRMLLFRAADNGLVEVMRLLIANLKADANTKDNDGRTLLHRAADNGQREVIKLLMAEPGTNVNVKDDVGRTPLHGAVYKGHVEVIRLLVSELKADIDAMDNYMRTPFHLAVDNRQVEVMRLLVAELGVDTIAKDNYMQAQLRRTLDKGDVESSRLLVTEFGVNVSAEDENGMTHFHWAVKCGHLNVVKLLVTEFGMNINAQHKVGSTLLHWAVQSGQVELLKLLMLEILPKELSFQSNRIGAKGAYVLAESLKQNTTLTQLSLSWNVISDEGARALAESLKQNTTLTQLNLCRNVIGDEGARALAESLKQNTTLTQLNLEWNVIGDEGARALAESLKQNTTLTQLNLEYNKINTEGAHALAESLKQNTTLTQLNLYKTNIDAVIQDDIIQSLERNAVIVKFINSIDLLMTEFGPDADVKRAEIGRSFLTDTKTDTRSTLLRIIAAHGHIGMARFFAGEFRAEDNVQDSNGLTPLHIAALRGHTEVARLLITELMANFNAKDNNGWTPLYMAICGGHAGVSRLLVTEFGADVNTKDNDGQAPLHLAARSGCVDVVRLLVVEFKADANAKDNNGRTPLHIAACIGHAGVTRLLLTEFGADVIAKDNDGQAAFHLAARLGHVDAVRLLMTEFGADLNAKTEMKLEAPNEAITSEIVTNTKKEALIMGDPEVEMNVSRKGSETLALEAPQSPQSQHKQQDTTRDVNITNEPPIVCPSTMPRSASPDRYRNRDDRPRRGDDSPRRRGDSPRRRDDSPRRRNNSSPSRQSRHGNRNDRPRRRDERNRDSRSRKKEDRRSKSPIHEAHFKAESSRRNRDRSRSRSSESSASGWLASENRSRREHEHKRKRSRSNDRSESSSGSDSESESERKKHRHKKKRHHDSDEKKYKKNKDKKKQKMAKNSKHKKDKKQNQWGAHGIVHEADMFTKEQEYHAWLLEVKNVSPETLKPAKIKEMFQGFIEDYNTATMLHEKFYNLKRWETRRMGEKPQMKKAM